MLGQLAIEPAVLLLDARETLPQRRRISNLGRASKLFDRAPRFRVEPLAHSSVQGIECVRDSLLVVPAAFLGHLFPPIGDVTASAPILLQVRRRRLWENLRLQRTGERLARMRARPLA